ncbi:MAG: DNA polymerase III subunit delta [Solirubrobacterales bacterium]|nr:DNA polymerase III subunit delta [Solirubrobacterales bacterium]MCB8969760.1 DNA polymerase III subunit delta [Thermoleophilales bacterium]MCO5327145.1 DNA polymerase III subunit delta [Solirubrobacterales bacterium]
MAPEMKPAYLLAGDDESKLSAALARLRSRAEREGGAGALEDFSGAPGAAPDADGLIGAMPAISLMASRRYLLADGVERWKAAQVGAIADALASAGPDITVVLVARGKAPKGLAEAVTKAGGDVLTYEAPRRRDLPSWLVNSARERGFQLTPQGARALVARVGEGTARLATEIDRLSIWAGEGGLVDIEDVEALTTDTSERAGWTLGDAIVARDVEAAVVNADALLDQGEAVTPLVYGMASRLRSAHQAAVMLAAGTPAQKVEAALPMAPYPSKMLVRSVSGVDPSALADAIGAIADLEWWTRGGSDYDAPVAMTLAVRRAAGGG